MEYRLLGAAFVDRWQLVRGVHDVAGAIADRVMRDGDVRRAVADLAQLADEARTVLGVMDGKAAARA